MNRKRLKKEMESLCGDVQPDDGIDPREFFRPPRKQGGVRRKAQQLCQQVADTLSYVLGEFDDELRELRVAQVRPAPDLSRLLVLVTPAVAGSRLDPEVVSAKLEAAAGRLRTEVAASITRRRAPRLSFRFVAELPPEEASR
jgi:ribosome-binding factor A